MREWVTSLVSVGQATMCEIQTFAMVRPSDTLIRGDAELLVDISGIAGIYLHLVSVGGIAIRHIYDHDIRKRKFDWSSRTKTLVPVNGQRRTDLSPSLR